MFGWTEMLIVLGIVVLLFGSSRIPELARSLGESVNEFRSGLGESREALMEDVEEPGSD
jgi:sec-independent protein translocase protein TatA